MATLLVDTREKDNKGILEYCKKRGVPYREIKLDEGDYQSDENASAVVDLKNGITEVQRNIAGTKAEKERFLREVQRCIDKGKTLIVLVREEKIYAVKGVEYYWKSPTHMQYDPKTKQMVEKPYTKVSGKFIARVMESYAQRYGIVWKFCKPQYAGATIVRILNEYGGNIKTNGL